MSRYLPILAMLALAVPTASLAKPGDIEVYQRNAGTPDAAGFTKAVSVNGGFSLEMPCKFNELGFADAPNTDGKSPFATSATIFLCVDPEKLPDWGMVLKAGYDTGAAGADMFFERQFADDSKAGKANRLTYGKDRAFISVVKDGDTCKWKLAVRHGADLVTLNFFAKAADCSTTKARADRFMNSLEFTR